jgi:hypothetical protein
VSESEALAWANAQGAWITASPDDPRIGLLWAPTREREAICIYGSTLTEAVQFALGHEVPRLLADPAFAAGFHCGLRAARDTV